MTLDQKIQIWVAVGTWLSSIGTIAAVITALYLAKRAGNMRLNVRVGLMVVVIGDGKALSKSMSVSTSPIWESGPLPSTLLAGL